jgi:hypothetical protein
MSVSNEFGNWFAGFFDGEGHFMIDVRKVKRKSKKYNNEWWNVRQGLQIKLRNDDEGVIDYIIENLKTGRKNYCSSYKTTQKSCVFAVHDVATLAEIFIPLFDKYPLRGKKSKEYTYWRELVKERYITSCGGKSPTKNSDEYIEKAKKYMQEVRKIRHPVLLQK